MIYLISDQMFLMQFNPLSVFIASSNAIKSFAFDILQQIFIFLILTFCLQQRTLKEKMENFEKIKINGHSYAFINVRIPKACVNYKFFDKQKTVFCNIQAVELPSQGELQLPKYVYEIYCTKS